MEWGTAGEWAGAIFSLLTGVAAICLAISANKTAREANSTAEKSIAESRQANEDAKAVADQQLDEMRHTAEAQRAASEQRQRELDRRTMADSLTAWWSVQFPDTAKETWGVVVANTGTSARVVRNVTINAPGPFTKGKIQFSILPPGTHFVPQDPKDGWLLPRAVRGDEPMSALTRSTKHDIAWITFTDSLSQAWRWDPKNGAQRLEVTEQPSSPQGVLPTTPAGEFPRIPDTRGRS